MLHFKKINPQDFSSKRFLIASKNFFYLTEILTNLTQFPAEHGLLTKINLKIQLNLILNKGKNKWFIFYLWKQDLLAIQIYEKKHITLAYKNHLTLHTYKDTSLVFTKA